MKILGCNIGETSSGVTLKDGATTLIEDGIVSLSVPEDRLSRKKHAGGFSEGLSYVMNHMSGGAPDIIGISTLGETVNVEKSKIPDIKKLLIKYPQLAHKIVLLDSHHLSHAYSVFPYSGFETSLIVVVDMEGSIVGERTQVDHWKNSLERVSYFLGHRSSEGIHIQLLEREFDEPDVVGPGEAYGMFTHFLGFKSYVNSGKTMGLAPFGDERFFKIPLYDKLPDGKARSRLRNAYHGVEEEIARFFRENGHDIQPASLSLLDENHKAIARLIQSETERVILEGIKRIRKKYAIKTMNVCMAGGVALNCVMNSRILEEGIADQLYIQPACGDTGQSLGVATHLYYNYEYPFLRKHVEMPSVFTGPEYSRERIIATVSNSGFPQETVNFSNFESFVIQRILEGKIVGWFQGRSELGPRALGNRSILANPLIPDMKDILNRRVKHREEFRPFAPICTEEDAYKYFEIDRPTPYMLMAPKVRPEYRHILPAITHVDGSARLQTVSYEQNPKIYKLLKEMERLSGFPILINTSLNDGGDPLVESPEDAIECFKKTGLDHIVIENFILSQH